MSFDWREFLNLAKELCGQQCAPASADAKLRTSISRAYYGAFCHARNYLRDVEGLRVPEGPEAHGFVIDAFTGKSDKALRRVGTRLDRLRVDRNKVDYEDEVSGLQPMSVVATKVGWRIISALPSQ